MLTDYITKTAAPMKTGAAARCLGCKPWQLAWLLRTGNIPAPDRDTRDQYVWSEQDLERARDALAGRRICIPRKAPPP
jgi:hypothetical protein